MAAKAKIIKATTPTPRLEVVKTRGTRIKNGFNFHEIRGIRYPNVIVAGVGYDTYTQAKRAAKRYNSKLKAEYQMPIYYSGKVI